MFDMDLWSYAVTIFGGIVSLMLLSNLIVTTIDNTDEDDVKKLTTIWVVIGLLIFTGIAYVIQNNFQSNSSGSTNISVRES